MKTLREKIEVMEAFERGEKIQVRFRCDHWSNTENPTWNWKSYDYRVKPENKYEAYSSPDEIKLGVEVRLKENKKIRRLIIGINEVGVIFGIRIHDFKDAFDNFEYLDGTPFGKRVNNGKNKQVFSPNN